MAFLLQTRESHDNGQLDSASPMTNPEAVVRFPSLGSRGLPTYPYVGIENFFRSCQGNEGELASEARIGGQLRFAEESAQKKHQQEQADALTSAAFGPLGGGVSMVRSRIGANLFFEKVIGRGKDGVVAIPEAGLRLFSPEELKKTGSAIAIAKVGELERLLKNAGVTAKWRANDDVTNVSLQWIRLPETANSNPAAFTRNLATEIRDSGFSAIVGRFDFTVRDASSKLAENLSEFAQIAKEEFQKIFPGPRDADIFRHP